MSDKATVIDNSAVHHGKHNNRVYITHFSDKDGSETIEKMNTLAGKNGYDKIVAKINSGRLETFKDMGFSQEAKIPSAGGRQYVFVSKFLNPERKVDTDSSKVKSVLDTALSTETENKQKAAPEVIRLKEKHIPDMIEIYEEVFETYPFPIHDPDFIADSMKDSTRFYGICEDGRLTALSSAEICKKSETAEMTDFATLPEARNKGFASALLKAMEEDLRKSSIKTFYTIARAVSYGMNITFAKADYEYGGTLINNTNISGNIESMNVWYKQNC